jgi:hypothetical protein
VVSVIVVATMSRVGNLREVGGSLRLGLRSARYLSLGAIIRTYSISLVTRCVYFTYSLSTLECVVDLEVYIASIKPNSTLSYKKPLARSRYELVGRYGTRRLSAIDWHGPETCEITGRMCERQRKCVLYGRFMAVLFVDLNAVQKLLLQCKKSHITL